MKETLINHNCQTLLFNPTVPEETPLCLLTKLLILSLSLSLSLSRSLPVDARSTRTRQPARTLGGRSGGCQVISCTKNQLSGASYRDTPPKKKKGKKKKDVDLPTEKMSQKISIIHRARRAPALKRVVKPLIMLFIPRRRGEKRNYKIKHKPSPECQVTSAFFFFFSACPVMFGGWGAGDGA